MKALWTVGSLCLLLAFPYPAEASDPSSDSRAKELYENGAQLYEEARYEDAIVAWRAAYELSPRPLLLYNIASAEERSGQWKEAIETWNRYRAFAPAEERKVLEQRIRNLEKRVVDMEADAAESEASTREPWRKERELQPQRVDPNGRTDDSGVDGVTGATTAGQAAATTRAPGPHPGPFVLLGGGFAGLAAGAVLGGLALDRRAQAEASCHRSETRVLCPNTAEQSLAQDSQMSLGADLALGIGVAAAVAGGTLAIIDAAKRKKASDSVELSLAPSLWWGPEGGGISLSGRMP